MKFTIACAIASAAAIGADVEFHGQNYSGYGVKQQGGFSIGSGLGYAAPASASYSAPAHGYGQSAVGGRLSYGKPAAKPASYGKQWVRRSSIRPRDISAQNVAPTDDFYLSKQDKADETIVASCEFDFLGFSHSSGRLELQQKPNDLTSLTGEFDRIKPGVHALKIHEFGDLEYGCKSAGQVYNPFGVKQGMSHFDIHERRVGDIE